MKLDFIADEARLHLSEQRDHLNQLELAILKGHSKLTMAHLLSRRSRLPALAAVTRTLDILRHHRNLLPPDLLMEIEQDVP